MLKRKTSSINFKTLVYLVIFSVTILLLLIFSQNILLKYSYEKYQEKKIKNVASSIKGYKLDDVIQKLEAIVYDNGVCAQLVMDNNVVSYNTLMVGCGLNKGNSQIADLMNQIMDSNKNMQHIRLMNKNTNTKAIL